MPVDRLDLLADEVAAAHLDGIDPHLLRRFIQRDLEGEARLHRAVAALGPAGRLVGIHSITIESISSKSIRAGEQLSGVVRGHQPEGRVRAAVDEDLVVHRRDAAVPIEAQPGAAEPVISKRRVENERPSEKSRRILLAQLRSAGARPLDRGRVVVHREDHVHTRTRLHETADRGRRDPPHRHDQVGVASQARQRAAQDLDGVLDGEL